MGNFPKYLENIPRKLEIFQNIWGIFPKNCASSKTIMETSATYFWGTFHENWELSEKFGEYSPKIENFPKYLGNIS